MILTMLEGIGAVSEIIFSELKLWSRVFIMTALAGSAVYFASKYEISVKPRMSESEYVRPMPTLPGRYK